MRLTPSVFSALLTPAALFAQGPSTTILGTGCGGSGGAASIALSAPLRPGYTSSILLDHLPPASIAAMLIGLSGSTWNGHPLPAALTQIGMPGCNLHMAPNVGFAFGTGTGTPSW